MLSEQLQRIEPDPAGYLSALDDDWARLIGVVGKYDLKLKPHREPYEALVRAIAHQQLHSRAAEAILGRFLASFPNSAFPEPHELLAINDELLRGCGFSASKILAIKGIATGVIEGVVPSSIEAQTLSDDELIKRLVTLRGVGRWTVEMLLIFTLGRSDVLPVDDYGVREGWRKLKALPAQPKPRQFAEEGRKWSPHRTAAAWYLWRAAEL